MEKQTTGLKRKTIDKYYTSQSTVSKCIELIDTHINIQKEDLCIEPSAGNGSFIQGIETLSDNSKFYDLEPEHSDIVKQDFLELDYSQISNSNQYPKIHIIGNPPFGRQSSLAIKFIKKSAIFCDSISFILPKSFKKQSLRKHFPSKFHLYHEYDLPDNSFIVDGVSHNVPCVFQIWIKKMEAREMPPKLLPTKFSFVKKTADHDISFRRVGIYAGQIDKNTTDKSFQSHYFIKFNEDITLTEDLFGILSKLEYGAKEHTVGPKSISKQELIKEFNEIL